jgi:hypothetical protein
MNNFQNLFTVTKPLKRSKHSSNIDPTMIAHYGDGWRKVCTVKSTRVGNEWVYVDIDQGIMYSDHTSWVYAIVVDGVVVKFGESGVPLGIRTSTSDQPLKGTKCRLGRYRNHKATAKEGSSKDTDEEIRKALRSRTQSSNHVVEIYAIKCREVIVPTQIGNTIVDLKSKVHKHLEKALLDYYYTHCGRYPELNPNRA